MGKRYFSPGNAVDLSIYIMSIVIVSNVSIGMPSWSLCQTEEVYYHVYYIVQLGQGQLMVKVPQIECFLDSRNLF